MPGLCCVPKCNGRGGHRFPSDRELFKDWLCHLCAVKRGEPNSIPSKWILVCKAHVTDDDYISRTCEGDGVAIKILKAGVVPHVFDWTRVSKAAKARTHRAQKREIHEEMLVAEGITPWAQLGSKVENENYTCTVVTEGSIDLNSDTVMDKDASREPASTTCKSTQTNSTRGMLSSDFIGLLGQHHP